LSLWSRLFPHFGGLQVERVLVTAEAVHIQVRRTAWTASCSACGRRSRRVHSRYTRRIADEPIGGRPVEIHLQIRRFRCDTRNCPRRTFAEQVPQLADRRGRRTIPLLRLLQDIGLTIGGRPGARFADRHTIAVSRMTLIRLVRALPMPAVTSPRVLGVDDFALRRRHHFGTVLVDVATSKVVDLLPDRKANSLSTWLEQHEPPELICRDRAGDYPTGATGTTSSSHIQLGRLLTDTSLCAVQVLKRLDRMRTAGHSAVGGVWAGFSHLMSTALARPPIREFAHKVTTADDANQATFSVDDGYPLQVL
jgi:hypothetical protein